MGGTKDIEKKDAPIDLNTEVDASALKLPPEKLTPEYREQVAKFYTDEPLGKSEKIPPAAPPENRTQYFQGGGGVNEPLPEGLISIDDFARADLRVGRIEAAESVPKSDKLWKFTVNFGDLGSRTILASIKKSFPDPQLLVGNRYVFVVNLPPRKMMGIESNGMILAAPTDTPDGRALVACDGALGSRLG
jgi:methionine--tRNA ligase beta chain